MFCFSCAHHDYSTCSCFYWFLLAPVGGVLLVVGLFFLGLVLDRVCLMLAPGEKLLAASGVGPCDVGGVGFLSPKKILDIVSPSNLAQSIRSI